MAETWSVVRMSQQAGSDVALTCLDGEYPLTVTLRVIETGEIDTITLCVPLEDPDPCTVLDLLAGAGYSPNDWSIECP